MNGVATGRLLLLGALASIAVIIASSGGDFARAAGGDVSIINFAFQPTPITVNIGDTVTWTNNGTVPHTASSTSPLFDSGALAVGQTYSFTFNTAGDFAYICNIHPSMHGTVTVLDPSATATFTPTATSTSTSTPTQTPTPTVTSSATPTVTNSTTPTVTATPTVTPTATPTGTPRALRVQTIRAGANRLLVTVTARDGGTMDRLSWTLPPNAAAETIGGTSLPTGMSLPASSTTASFYLRRVSGQTVTLPITITGSFGTWSTFVGGGPGAW